MNNRGSAMVESAIVLPIVIISIVIVINMIVALFHNTKNEMAVYLENQRESQTLSGVTQYHNKKDVIQEKDALYYSFGKGLFAFMPILKSELNNGYEKEIVIFGEKKTMERKHKTEGYIIDETEYIRKIDLIVDGVYSEISSLEDKVKDSEIKKDIKSKNHNQE